MTSAARPRAAALLAIAIVAAVLVAARRHRQADAPFSPRDDAEVLERLPAGAGADPVADETRRLEAELARHPHELALAVEVARRHVDAARRNADARRLAYAEAALAPWWNAEQPPLPALLVRATVARARLDLPAALADLERATARPSGTPLDAEARLATATVLTALGRYDEAVAACARVAASALVERTCEGAALAPTDKARAAYTALVAAVGADGADPAEARAARAVLGELAYELGDMVDAERELRAALAADPGDADVRARLADVLLDAARPREVLSLVGADEPNDALLLRRAIASRRTGAPDAASLARELRSRADERALRGDRTLAREDARRVLELDDAPARALPIAIAAFARAKTPWAARLVLASASSTDAAAIAPVLAWADATRCGWPPLRAALERLRAR